MKFITLLFLLLILIVFSCSQGYIINKNEKTKFPEGRDLFASKCNGCHKLPFPQQFNSSQWDSILVPMKVKAKLTDEQCLMIFDWLTENRSDTIITGNN